MESMLSIEEPKNSIVLISISFKAHLNTNQAIEKQTTWKVVIEKEEENACDFNGARTHCYVNFLTWHKKVNLNTLLESFV